MEPTMAAETTESDHPAADTPSVDPSTNWIVVGGSLLDSIAFDTSSSFHSDAAGEVSAAKGAAFLQEPASGCGPCEINICFKQKHDIHSVYMRSTAHVYEIYYALEQPCQSNEYLCTVRCGEVAAKDSFPEIDEHTLPMKPHSTKQASSNLSATATKSFCTNGSDEDGWIDVNVPDSPVILDKSEILKNNSDSKVSLRTQVCYEATAEISDLSPCISVTLRLLSLQPKGQVYLEEIYIYADPVDTEASGSNQGMSLGSNVAGTSLLSMLIPGLLHFSKSGNGRREDKGTSDTCDTIATKETENGKFGIARETPRESYFSGKSPIGVCNEVPVQICQNTNLGSCQEVPVARTDTPCHRVDDVGHARIEKILEGLLSRVGRIETFCASFEDKMAKPLLAIEMKLQKLEQQLDLLIEGANCSRPPRSPRTVAQEFGRVGSDCENRDRDVRAHILLAEHSNARKFPVLHVRAPEFEQDDTPCCSSNTYSSSGRAGLSEEKRSSPDTPECNQESESKATCNESLDSNRERNRNGKGSKFSAPEFFSEEYSPSVDNTSAPPEKNHSNDRSAFSIDTALASALEAFLFSTTKSQECNRPSDAQEQSGDDCKDVDSVVEVASEKAEIPKDFEQLDESCNEANRKNDASRFISGWSFPLGGTNVQDNNNGIAIKIASEIQETCQPSISIGVGYRNEDEPSATFEGWGFISPVVDGPNDNRFPVHTIHESHFNPPNISNTCVMANSLGVKCAETFAGSDVEEADQHPNKKRWFGESSTESIADGLNVDSCHAGWSDLSSADSVEVKFPLPSWLTGRGSDCESETDYVVRVTAGSLNAGFDMSGPALMNPDMGTEPEKTCDSLLDFPQLILKPEASHDANDTTASVLKDLLSDLSNDEEKLCEPRDVADKSRGGLSSSSRHSADASKSCVVDDQPLIDVVEDSRVDGSGSMKDVNEPLVDVEEIIPTARSSSTKAYEHSYTIAPDLQLPFSSLI